MFLYKDIINIVLGFLLIFIMAYLLGTSILDFYIDHRMTDISINMPKINLPKPINVYLKDNNNPSSNHSKIPYIHGSDEIFVRLGQWG